jgi:hypothetical protein
MLTVFDKRLVRQLNHFRSCGDLSSRTQWRVGERRDVTATSGCPSIGVHVASVESDVVRLTSSTSPLSYRGHAAPAAGRQNGNVQASRPPPLTQQLYLGQRPTDGGHLTKKSRRPTSFQPALVRCAGGSSSVREQASSKSTGGGKRGHGEGLRQRGPNRGADYGSDETPSGGSLLSGRTKFTLAFALLSLALNFAERLH